MKLTLREFTRTDLVRCMAEYVRNSPYLFVEEVADSIEDGSWIEYFNKRVNNEI